MTKLDTVWIAGEAHGLAGNLVLPAGASPEGRVPGAVVVGGPGPAPLQRYTRDGFKEWPMLWTERLAESGVAGLCYDQRGSGLSGGQYHEADEEDLYADCAAAVEMLRLQPEVGRVAAVAWDDGTSFALRLAAEGRVDALILLAPGFLTAEARYRAQVSALAARKGLSDRVVQIRLRQWQAEVEAIRRRVEAGERVSTSEVGGRRVTTNLLRLLHTLTFDPAEWAGQCKVPVLILHGADDAVIPPGESETLAAALGGPVDRIVYPGQGHFLYRHRQAVQDAADWIRLRLT